MNTAGFPAVFLHILKAINMKNNIIRSIYFYAVSIVALFMLVFSGVDLINTALKQWVFTGADPNYNYCMPVAPAKMPSSVNIPAGPTQEDCDRQNEQNRQNTISQRQNSAVRDLSMLVIALPLFLFHFRIVQKEWKERKEA